jgi:hypothetical protein
VNDLYPVALLLLWFGALVTVAVAGFLFGWQYRDEHEPSKRARTVMDAISPKPK